MKYFRTKETIYEVVEEKELVIIVKAKNGKGTYAKSKSQIDMKQYSDNLYRLINKFIVAYKNGKSVVSKYMFKKHRAKYLKKMNMGGKIYGAIWVENNGIPMLKSVAIMVNDKGELELI